MVPAAAGLMRYSGYGSIVACGNGLHIANADDDDNSGCGGDSGARILRFERCQ